VGRDSRGSFPEDFQREPLHKEQFSTDDMLLLFLAANRGVGHGSLYSEFSPTVQIRMELAFKRGFAVRIALVLRTPLRAREIS
jgi:hypothetical protein